MFRRALPVLAATLLVACGGSSDADVASVEVAPSPTAAPASTATPAPTAGPGTAGDPATSEVPAALQLTAPLVGGGEIELGAYAGRPVLLWFWAPW